MFKYPLEPNRRQAAILADWLEGCRNLYNVALEQRREYRRRATPKSIGYMDQTRELTELRAADPRYREMPAEVCRSALRNLQRAFEAFFRRVKRGEKPGYPRFRGRGRFDSFGIGRPSVEGRKVRIPKLGLIKFRKYRELGGEIRDAKMGLHAGRWWIAFSCDRGDGPPKKPPENPIGIDLGLDSFAVLSDGTQIANPRFFRKAEEKLAVRQQAICRKSRGSVGRARAKLLLQKAHQHVRQQRLDFARKLAAHLYRSYDCVVHEDLNIKGLSQGRFAKSVQDVAWGMFLRALADKAECAGRWVVRVDPRGTSIRCSTCSNVVPKELSDRVHRCPRCGLVMHRDENAARNILALGRSVAAVLGRSSGK